MDTQSKLDVIASIAILVMFVGAYVLTVSRFGIFMIAGGAIAMVFPMLKTFRTRQ
jgi:uncharacterized membrane protein